MTQTSNYLSHFCIAGINYRKSDINVRGKFSLTTEQCEQLLKEVVAKSFPGAFVVSTCNRTEVYGISPSPQELVELLCLHSQGRIKDFIEHGYVYQGIEAMEHLFKVAAGLDSQIVGDHEILGQLKMAAKFAKERGCLNNFMERVVNFAIQSSKRIKTETQLSSGTVSVSYAAVEIIREKVADLVGKKILLVGTGKFGHNVGINLKTYLPECSLVFCNRTDEKASHLADKCKANFIAYDKLPESVNDADIVIVSTSSENYTVDPSFFTGIKSRLVLDLSVPQNVDPAVANIPGIELMNVDEISAILDRTIDRRKAEIPQALNIINEMIEEMKEWYCMQQHNPLLRHIKTQLSELTRKIEEADKVERVQKNDIDRIQKTVTTLAIQLRTQNNKGCQCIHAMNDYLHMN
jgi:glutamyl-tRNA reductase